MVHSKIRSTIARSSSVIRGLIPYVEQKEIFPTHLLIHYTYHKCLTVYFKQVALHIGNEFHFPVKRLTRYAQELSEQIQSTDRKQFLILHDMHDVDFESLPPFRGTHVVRDPRDIVVSAYHYHLRTSEPWCIDPAYDWSAITGSPLFAEHVELDKKKWPQNTSYQDYLLSLSKEPGMSLEFIRNIRHFEHMLSWAYDNPDFLELKYENIVGNELESFDRIFDHYRVHPKVKERGLHYAEYFSLKKKSIGGKSHVRSGKKQQWKSELPPSVLNLFETVFPDLLAGYS